MFTSTLQYGAVSCASGARHNYFMIKGLNDKSSVLGESFEGDSSELTFLLIMFPNFLLLYLTLLKIRITFTETVLLKKIRVVFPKMKVIGALIQ